jgi:hypothetical protein
VCRQLMIEAYPKLYIFLKYRAADRKK